MGKESGCGGEREGERGSVAENCRDGEGVFDNGGDSCTEYCPKGVGGWFVVHSMRSVFALLVSPYRGDVRSAHTLLHYSFPLCGVFLKVRYEFP